MKHQQSATPPAVTAWWENRQVREDAILLAVAVVVFLFTVLVVAS